MTLYTRLFHLHTERVGETICRHNFPPKTSQISRALARRSRMLTQRSRPIADKAKTDFVQAEPIDFTWWLVIQLNVM